MKHVIYNHCDGKAHLSQTVQNEIISAIESIQTKPAKGAATKIRDELTNHLKQSGWSAKLAVAKGSGMTITSVKKDVGLCLQTGNMARLYADLLKLQTLYLSNSIKAAIILVPSKPLAKLLGQNIAQSTRLERELEIFKKAYHVPTLVFALEL